MQRLKTALSRAGPQCGRRPYRADDTFEVLGSKVLQVEEVAEQFLCALGDGHGVGLGNSLQTRRNVRRFADDRLGASNSAALAKASR